jgi:hypothetical protein
MLRMTRTHGHSLRTLATVWILASSIVGCYSVQHRSFDNGAQFQDASGVTTRSGKEIPFALSSASMKDDTLYALGEKGPLKMPADSISRISKRKLSAPRTIALAGGIGAVALVALIAASLSSFSIP